MAFYGGVKNVAASVKYSQLARAGLYAGELWDATGYTVLAILHMGFAVLSLISAFALFTPAPPVWTGSIGALGGGVSGAQAVAVAATLNPAFAQWAATYLISGLLLVAVAHMGNQHAGSQSSSRTQSSGGGSRRAPEYEGGELTESQFLKISEEYLGPGYKEASSGRYVSADGLRQVRFGGHETAGPGMHAHFEAYNQPASQGGWVVENTVVRIVP